MEVGPEIGQTDGFPALDFKFYNHSNRKDLLTRVTLDVRKATLDRTPDLHAVIGCREGDIVLYVGNSGWGDARDFKCWADLGPLGAALQDPAKLVTAPAIPAEADRSTPLVLASHRQVDISAIPPMLRKEQNEFPRYGVPSGGIEHLPCQVTYTSVDGQQYNDNLTVHTGGESKIYFHNDKFEQIAYDRGIRYSMIPPSCRYHFLLDPDHGARRYEKSIAHEISPDQYERIWIVIASNKSAHYDLECRFSSASGETIASPALNLHVWNPRNNRYRLNYATELGDVSYSATHGRYDY